MYYRKIYGGEIHSSKKLYSEIHGRKKHCRKISYSEIYGIEMLKDIKKVLNEHTRNG
jgi:hypothetical protein